MTGDGTDIHQPVRAGIAAFVGTMIEWYDFFIYGTAAALVFGRLFFPQVDSFYGTLAAFGTFAVGFLARPLGGAIFGHLGDRVGRKKSLIITLVMMGVSTVLIGLLPTHAMVGIWAPILLVTLRFVQGIAVGGEWGGAVLLASEHARTEDRRTFMASFAQLGSPAGLILSMVMFKFVTLLPEADLLSWGWRVPFLFSAVMLVVGFAIRMGVKESPDFIAARRRRLASLKQDQAPLREIFANSKGLLIAAICSNVLGIAGFYFTNTFMISYTTSYLGLARGTIIDCLLIVSIMQFIITPLSAYIAERTSVIRFLVCTAAYSIVAPYAMFTLVEQRDLVSVTLGIGIAVAGLGAYYAVIAGYVSASFPTRYRYTGISMAYQLSGAIFGGLTPLLGTMLAQKADGNWMPLAILFSVIATISLVSVLALHALRGRTDARLEPA
ncbi:LysR family transcriptional regulator [Methylobacterium sp. Leaf99]|jgi:MFS family permease|uniref:MFS transporter n=1 Tax=Methylobacterium sp. Leaf99 TaxID=1736251 RepID=UPI0006F8A0F6|nr:MFS transporter [Methylobacterium sp. Leaf99]KQP07987.1 LysR family transcriptional regulator [Methylobacterium sp. Leaf99]